MKTKIRALMASFVVASVALMGALGSAKAADDKWFVLGQQTIKSTDPSVDDHERGPSLAPERDRHRFLAA